MCALFAVVCFRFYVFYLLYMYIYIYIDLFMKLLFSSVVLLLSYILQIKTTRFK